MAPNPPFVANEIPSSAKWNTLVGVYDRSTSEVDVTNTTTETTLYTKTITAGHMSSDRALRLTLLGDYLRNASLLATVRVKFGATTLWQDTTDTHFGSATRRPFAMELILANLGATNSQYLTGLIRLGQVGGGTTGLGGFETKLDGAVGTDATRGSVDPIAGSAAEATTSDLAFAVTVQWSGLSASVSLRKKYAILELL